MLSEFSFLTFPVQDFTKLSLIIAIFDDRCGVRGSGRVAWELFLEKFQNPVSAGNGQTLPIQPNHK